MKAEEALDKMKLLVSSMQQEEKTDYKDDSDTYERIKMLKAKREILRMPEKKKIPDEYIKVKDYMIKVFGKDFCNNSEKLQGFIDFLLSDIDCEE